MSQKGKISIVVLFCLFIISLTAIGGLSYFFLEERDNLKRTIDNLNLEKNLTESKLVKLKEAVDNFNIQLDSTRKEITEILRNLEETTGETSRLDSKIETLKALFQEQADMKQEIEINQSKAQKEISDLRSLIQDLQIQAEEKKNKLVVQQEETAAEKQISLGSILVEQVRSGSKEAAGYPVAAPVLEGKVLVVNKDYDFTVINLGNEDGVTIGDVFSVYHNDRHIGDIQVEKAEEVMSACSFLSAKVKNRIRETDKVVRK